MSLARVRLTQREAEVRRAQVALNAFGSKLGYGKLITDGKGGPATSKAVRDAKFDLGYVRARIDDTIGRELIWRLEHPRSTHRMTKAEPWTVDRPAVARGAKRRAKRRQRLASLHVAAVRTAGVTYFDGKPVAKPMVQYMRWARDVGHRGIRWHGTLTSGWRSAAYSESLCYRICGRPSCPGRCAGRNTNHVHTGLTQPNAGAIDVSDYATFAALMHECPIEPRLTNVLPNDRVHFSTTGR